MVPTPDWENLMRSTAVKLHAWRYNNRPKKERKVAQLVEAHRFNPQSRGLLAINKDIATRVKLVDDRSQRWALSSR
jgi:hypothetical protein